MGEYIFIGLAIGIAVLFMGAPIVCRIIAETPRSCKNAAFREYKTRTIKNLEDEEQEFIKWLDEANGAADRAAFEQFKASKK